MFFGYDLPEHITPDDIMSFMVKFKQVIVDVEVLLNEKWGNYAKVTLSTSSDAHAAMKCYSGKYWPEFDMAVTLKPWKDKAGTNKSQSHAGPEVSVHNDDDNFSDSCESSHSSVQLSQSFSGPQFLPPYPGGGSKEGQPVYSQSETDLETLHRKLEIQQRKAPDHKTADSRKGRLKEYTVKLSGLKIDVDEKEIFELVRPFGDLTSRVRVASYPESGVCYAYANYCSMQAALNAVSQLDESVFSGQRIHVCHRGELGVEHSCKKELQTLAQQTSDSAIVCSGSTTASVDDIKEIWGYDDSDVVVVKPAAKVKAKIPSYASVVSDSPKLTKAASKSCKGPESKSKPKRQAKSLVEQPKFPSYGKSGFKGLLPYPCIDADVSQEPIRPLVHNQDVISSQLHDETVVNNPPYDQIMIKTLSQDEHVTETFPDYQFMTMPPQSNETFISVLPHCLNVIETQPYTENMMIENMSRDQLVVMASQHDEAVLEAASNQNLIKDPHQEVVNDNDLLPMLDQVKTLSQESTPITTEDVDPSCTSLQISNLHPDTSVQVLEKHLKPFGSLAAPISIRYHGDSDSCSAVIRYNSVEVCKSVMENLDGSEFNDYRMLVVRGDGKMPKSKGARNSGATNEGVPMIGEHMLVNKPDSFPKIKSPSPAKKNIPPAQ